MDNPDNDQIDKAKSTAGVLLAIIRVVISTAIVLFLFCGCSLVVMLFLNSIGFYGNPYADRPDSDYKTVDINYVVNERLEHPYDESASGVKYMDYVAAYGYVGGQHKNILGMIFVSVYGDSSMKGYYFDCSVKDNKQAEGLSIGDYVYMKGQVGGNGKSASIWDKYMTVVYCDIRRETPPDTRE